MPALVALSHPPALLFTNLDKLLRPISRNQIHHPSLAQHATTKHFLASTNPNSLNTIFRNKTTYLKPFTVEAFTGNMIFDVIPEQPSTLIHNEGLSYDSISSSLLLLDLDPATAKFAIGFIGPFLSVFGFLFVLRIVMSWYPNIPVGKFPYVLAYAPTEPLLAQTRKVIPPLGGVDVTPVVWFGLLSFLNEILVGPQGLLVLISQQT